MSGKHCGLVNGEYIPAPRVQDALATLLASCGFTQMSEDVKTEGDPAQLRRYARVIVKALPAEAAETRTIVNNLRILKLI